MEAVLVCSPRSTQSSHTPITWDAAVRAARIIKQHDKVKGVFVFGSVARDGSGRDLDLLIVADDPAKIEVYWTFKKALNRRWLSATWRNARRRANNADQESGQFTQQLRRAAAETVLGHDFADLVQEAQRTLGGREIDLVLCSPNWQEQVAHAIRIIDQTESFLGRVALEAQEVVD